MQQKLLLPNKYKMIGWCILIPSTILGIILCLNEFDLDWIHVPVFAIANEATLGNYEYMSVADTNITNTLIGSLFIIGALMVSFSKEKNEDEFIAEIRLASLLWAVWVSYILLLIAFLFVYGTLFLDVMIYNMFTVLIIFIVRFNYILYKNAKSAFNEK